MQSAAEQSSVCCTLHKKKRRSSDIWSLNRSNFEKQNDFASKTHYNALRLPRTLNSSRHVLRTLSSTRRPRSGHGSCRRDHRRRQLSSGPYRGMYHRASAGHPFDDTRKRNVFISLTPGSDGKMRSNARIVTKPLLVILKFRHCI